MTINEKTKATDDVIEKLVDNTPLSSLVIPLPEKRSTKKRIYRIAEPHIRPHSVKGKTYYTYCHGAGREIYLGDANTILKAVTASKQATGKNTG